MDESFFQKIETICREKKSSPLYLRIAEKEIQRQNYKRGIEILEGSLEDNSDCAAAYFLLGKAYSGVGNFKLALQSFRKGSEIIGSDKTYRYYLGEIEHLKRKQEEIELPDNKISFGDYKNLLSNSSYAIQSNEPSREIDENLISETLAKIYLNQGEINEAVNVYERLIRKYPLKKLYFESRIKEISTGSK